MKISEMKNKNLITLNKPVEITEFKNDLKELLEFFQENSVKINVNYDGYGYWINQNIFDDKFSANFSFDNNCNIVVFNMHSIYKSYGVFGSDHITGYDNDDLKHFFKLIEDFMKLEKELNIIRNKQKELSETYSNRKKTNKAKCIGGINNGKNVLESIFYVTKLYLIFS